MNVLITGCAGFIGSHAVDHFLENNYNVVGVDSFTYAARDSNLTKALLNPNFNIYRNDICDHEVILNLCVNFNIKSIINFAAETHVDNSIRDSLPFIKSNVIGVQSLLEVIRKLKIKFLHVSTDEVYGSIKEGEFIESDKLNPQNPYSATKASAEHLIRSYGNTYGINYLIVRPSNNFGPRQHDEKFLPTIIRSLRAGNKIPIYGEGSNIRDWLYVKDNVRAIKYILDNGKNGEIYNVTGKNELVNLELVKKICHLFEKDIGQVVEFIEDRLGHDFRYSISNKKLLDLGFKNFSNFDDDLFETIKELK